MVCSEIISKQSGFSALRLYYFTNARYGLEAIRDQRIKISTVDELNDPFEWLSVTGNRLVRTAMRKLRSQMGSQYGIICMSDNWKHPLLWAHYADKHKGLCLGFDVVENSELKKVEYVCDRVDWLKIRDKTFDEVGPRVLNMFNTKFDAWEYEAEYRMLVPLENRDTVSDLCFKSFRPEMSLAQVLVGERCTVSRQHLNRVLGPSSDCVESFKVRAGFKRFEIVRNQRQSDWK